MDDKQKRRHETLLIRRVASVQSTSISVCECVCALEE